MILFNCADIGEYIGESRQQINAWYRRGQMPKPYAYLYQNKRPLWKKEQIDSWIKEKWAAKAI